MKQPMAHTIMFVTTRKFSVRFGKTYLSSMNTADTDTIM